MEIIFFVFYHGHKIQMVAICINIGIILCKLLKTLAIAFIMAKIKDNIKNWNLKKKLTLILYIKLFVKKITLNLDLF